MHHTACAVLLALALAAPAVAQPRATVREFQQTLTTYPFSDPDPIPVLGRIYPYFRFDGYTDRPVQKSWTIVELENAHLIVRVLPQIGGKIWSAIDKASDKPFLYDNGVVKFRDIAMRGPWTSGGIEANYGIIGHTPNCATPTDYVTRTSADGSASVVIGVLDLLTRTPWRLEVTLPADAAYFTTRSFWQNTSPMEQPYYTWMNVGLKAAGNLQFVYPGTHFIGHDGKASPWPIHPENGKDLSYYEQNDFGPYKSYHVVGRHTDFFGAYWHDEDFGMARYSTRDDKPGKKIWIWGLSQQGMIWETLLTDTSGQYVEVQSGRLFNQSAEESVSTPFKYRGFAPGSTDAWTEYWFPVKGTKGFVKANAFGALNVTREGEGWRIALSPLQRRKATLEVSDADTVVFSQDVDLLPLRAWSAVIPRAVPAQRLRARIGGDLLVYAGNATADDLARPLSMPAGFDWESAAGRHLRAKALIRQREYGRAREALEASLQKDPHFVAALVDLAMIRLRALDAKAAFDLARHALSVDTYDPGANFYYGVAAAALGREADARDGFEIASQSLEYRAAAWHQSARLAARSGAPGLARHYATRAAEASALDADALQVLATLDRLEGRPEAASAAVTRVLALDPLSHHARFERYLLSGTDGDRAAFVDGIRNEMPHETYLELASWYRGLGRDADAEAVLALAPRNAEVLYWRAFLRTRVPVPSGSTGPDTASDALASADAASVDFVLPFRPESVEVLRWAMQQTASWKPRYLLALIHLGLGNGGEAATLLDACGDRPDFAPFYALRSATRKAAPAAALADLQRAAALEPAQWRFGRRLVDRFTNDGNLADALGVADRYHRTFPDNYVIGMQHARVLLLSGRAKDAAGVLAKLRVLPYEGATEGRQLYRMAHLALAIDALRAGDIAAALTSVGAARQWPEHLGAGKPYPADVDESVEDALEWRALSRARRTREADAVMARLKADAPRRTAVGALAAALVLRQAAPGPEADRALARWAAAEPDPVMRTWGEGMLAGTPSPAPAEVNTASPYSVVAALATLR
jgi:Tfp pilus assembly protein PilF